MGWETMDAGWMTFILVGEATMLEAACMLLFECCCSIALLMLPEESNALSSIVNTLGTASVNSTLGAESMFIGDFCVRVCEFGTLFGSPCGMTIGVLSTREVHV